MLSSVIRRQFLLSRTTCFGLSNLLQESSPSGYDLSTNSTSSYHQQQFFYNHQAFHYDAKTLLIQPKNYLSNTHILSCRRGYTTNNDTPPQPDDNNKGKSTVPKKLGTIQKFRYMIDVFWTGCKALFKDVRLAFQTRRKLGLYQVQDFSRLTREELRHMRQTKQDLVKTFPVAFLFMVPFIGYSAPVLAYFYPRQLLSQQFWHPDQKSEFVLEEYEKRSQYYLPLIKECGWTAKEIHNEELLKFCLKTLDGFHPPNEELLEFQNVFTQHEDFSLQKMPRYHLVKICKCWLIPTGWYLPRWYLINALNKRILRLHQDDILIVRDGIDSLTPECIEQAVHVRGLDEASLNDESKRFWLQEWIQLSSNVKGEDVSFLAHSAVFKAANFETLRNDSRAALSS